MMIGVGLDARLGLPLDQLRAAAREAGQLGFESVWTPAGGVPDSFHVCSAWSQDTGLRTGISVVPAARMWTPLGLAAQTATLAQLSAGQFVLGIGTGGYGPGFWASVGLPDRPIAVMREYVTQVRALLAGERVTAGQSLDWGLINQVWPDAELGAQADALVAHLAEGPTLSYAGTKRQLNNWLFRQMDEQLEFEAGIQQEMAGSHDFAEGAISFVEKRAPRFTGM